LSAAVGSIPLLFVVKCVKHHGECGVCGTFSKKVIIITAKLIAGYESKTSDSYSNTKDATSAVVALAALSTVCSLMNPPILSTT
jgi:hypothetical protein